MKFIQRLDWEFWWNTFEAVEKLYTIVDTLYVKVANGSIVCQTQIA